MSEQTHGAYSQSSYILEKKDLKRVKTEDKIRRAASSFDWMYSINVADNDDDNDNDDDDDDDDDE